MTPDIEKIEHLLNGKTFEQLSVAERELVLAHLSGKAEYEHMRETLSRVKKIFTAEAAFVGAEADMKDYVLNRFEQNKPTSVSLYDRISTFFNTLLPTPTARFGTALGSVLVICTATFLLWPNTKNEMAMDLESTQKAPAASTMVDSTNTLVTQDELAAVPMERDKEDVNTKNFTTFDDVVVMDEEASAGDGMSVQEFKAAPEPLPEPKKALELRSEQKPAASEVQNNVYMNNEGFYQYNNNRSAEVVTEKKNSDLKKDYSPRKPSSAGAERRGNGKAEEAEKSKTAVNKNIEQGTLTTVAGSSSGSVNQDQTVVSGDLEVTSIPVWAGYENDANAYAVTAEKIKVFITDNNYDKLENAANDDKNKTTVSLLLTFDANGQVIKAQAKGNIAETAKKEIETKAIKLPVFKFTNGGNGNKLTRQNYSITY